MNSLKIVSIRNLLIIAVPIMISQASETIMMFTDRLFLAKLGDEYIGPAMSGGLSSFVFSSFFIAVLGYLNAVTSQHYGAGKKEETVRYTIQGLYLSLFFFPIALLLTPLGFFIFSASGHSSQQIALEGRYFLILMFGAGFVFVKAACSGFLMGVGKTKSVMIANFIGMILNVPLNYVLIFGKFGFPELGIAGAAIGTILGSFTTCVILLILVTGNQIWRESYQKVFLRFDKKYCFHLFKFGFPSGLESFVNVLAFNLFLQLMHSYGTSVAASVTIAFNYDLVAFIPILGLGASATTMVGYQVGAKDISAAKKAIKLNLILAYGYAGCMALIFTFFSLPLVRVFTHSREIIPLAQTMLRMAAIYTLADATQVVFSGSLRGAGDTKSVMIISSCFTWFMAVSSFFVIKIFHLPPLYMWTIFVSILLLLGFSMFLRYKTGKWQKFSLVEDKV